MATKKKEKTRNNSAKDSMKKTTLKKTLAAAKPTVATSVPATETGVAPTTNSTLATTPETTATAAPISETATANANERMLIYQVLPRLYGNTKTINHHAGTIEENGCGKMNDFTEPVLKSIKDFGYTHIWYTGLLEHATQTSYADHGIAVDNPIVVKGKAGSPYAIKDYYDIDPDLAKNVDLRMKEFEALVARTHHAGLKMVIDFVPNHVARQYHSDAKPATVKDLGEDDNSSWAFSPENNFYYIPGEIFRTAQLGYNNTAAANGIPSYKEYPAKATGNDQFTASPSRNDWYETIKLNYGVDYQNGRSTHFNPIPDTWKKMTAILLFWAKKGVDAFRCDMAEMVPCEFWHYAIAKVKESYPNIRFIAEVYNPNEYRNYIHHGGFDYLYDKVGLYDTLRAVTCGYGSAAAITGCWQSVDDIQPHMLNFLENHDEQRIASDFFAGNAEKGRPALVVSACMNTNPMMIYAGQELGEKGMDEEGFSGRDGRTTIFDYWTVNSLLKLNRGEEAFTTEEKALYHYYQKIMRLCNQEAALREGKFYDLMYVNYDRCCGFNPDRHYAFLRKAGKQTLLIVANFSEEDCHIGVRIPNHAFEYLSLRKGIRHAIDLISGNALTLELTPDGHTYADVPANSAVILKFEE